jgi:hypothetical protein
MWITAGGRRGRLADADQALGPDLDTIALHLGAIV